MAIKNQKLKNERLAKTKTEGKPRKPVITRVTVNNSNIKSPYVVNLKNSNPISLAPTNLNAIRPELKPVAKIKPPKVGPKRAGKIAIDFIASEKNLGQLSNLFLSLKKLFKKKIKPVSEPKIITPATARAEKIFDEEEVEDVFAPPSDFNLAGTKIPKDWYKPIGIFLIIICIIVLPFGAFGYYQKILATKNKILLLTNKAIDDLKRAQNYALNLNLSQATGQFNQAQQDFILAEKEISQINAITTEILKILPDKSKAVASGMSLLAAGQNFAEAGQILSAAGDNFLNNGTKDYFNSLLNLRTQLELGLAKFAQAQKIIDQIDVNNLPLENQATFNEVRQFLPPIKKNLTEVHTLLTTLLKILGERQWQRYLVFFANNNELRGSGGFLGSFALLDLDRGQIKKIDIPGGGTYSVQGYLGPRVLSPQPLHLINPRWEFQDSNWWPDFPSAAKKMEWFYKNANGPSVDGVIVMTASLMEKLLEVVGPIPMPEYKDRVIDSKNFVTETQKIVELEYDKQQNQPKQFIADLAPKLLAKIFDLKGEELKKVIAVVQTGLNEKNLLLYFNEPETEKVILALDWGGKIKDTKGDFLSVVNTNLAGGKTDEVITNTIQHQAEISADGSIIDTVKLIRKHHGIAGENIFTGVQNNSYTRFYVPAGSTLLEATGFKKPPEKYFKIPPADLTPDIDLISIQTSPTVDEKTGTDIYKESGKTVFGNWLSVKPGETKEVIIKYKLPFKLLPADQNKFYYSLLTQKQSGDNNTTFTSNLIINNKFKPSSKYPESLKEKNHTIQFSADLNTDQFYGVTLISQ